MSLRLHQARQILVADRNRCFVLSERFILRQHAERARAIATDRKEKSDVVVLAQAILAADALASDTFRQQACEEHVCVELTLLERDARRDRKAAREPTRLVGESDRPIVL